MDITKMSLPNFVHLTAVGTSKDSNQSFRFKIRVNPFHISSYEEAPDSTIDGETIKVTVFYCGARAYAADMHIYEFDKMINEIERGLSINTED